MKQQIRPSIIVDRFAPVGMIAATKATWPKPDSGVWHQYENGKLATKSTEGIPRAAWSLLNLMAQLDVAKELQIDHEIFPDIEYLHAAGLHQLNPGSELGKHLDTERHPLLPWRRQVSMVLYLDECIGGNLELFERPDDEFGEIVECKSNRLAIFSTPGQWHRVTQTDSLRRSICLFWWSIDESVSGRTQSHFI